MGNIIGTMSYSKVKANGYPKMGEYQLAYHIVREADLLAAYDIDRCIMYDMYRNNSDYFDALQEAFKLFEKRVFRMRRQRLFTTSYAKRESLQLHKKAKKRFLYFSFILHLLTFETLIYFIYMYIYVYAKNNNFIYHNYNSRLYFI